MAKLSALGLVSGSAESQKKWHEPFFSRLVTRGALKQTEHNL